DHAETLTPLGPPIFRVHRKPLSPPSCGLSRPATQGRERRAAELSSSAFRPTNPLITEWRQFSRVAYYRSRRRSFGGRCAPTTSPRQLKEVIQVAHSHVGSVAILVNLTHHEVHG